MRADHVRNQLALILERTDGAQNLERHYGDLAPSIEADAIRAPSVQTWARASSVASR